MISSSFPKTSLVRFTTVGSTVAACMSHRDMSFGPPAAGNQARSDTQRDCAHSPGTLASSHRYSESMELTLQVRMYMVNASNFSNTTAPKSKAFGLCVIFIKILISHGGKKNNSLLVLIFKLKWKLKESTEIEKRFQK